MKNIFTFLLNLLVFQSIFGQIEHENFESATTNLTWQPLDGNQFLHGKFTADLANPNPDAVNNSAKIGQYEKGFSAFSTLQISKNGGFDLTVLKQFELDILPPSGGGEVILELFSTNLTHEIKQNLTASNQWQTLKFDFWQIAGANFSEIRLTFNFGTAANNQIWSLDNLRQTAGAGDPCLGQSPLPTIVSDFECQENYVSIFYGAGDISKVANPFPMPENPSEFVGKYIDPPNSAWAGVGFSFSSPLNFGNSKILECKIWSPQVGIPMLFKLEGAGAGVEFQKIIPEKEKWVTFNIDFTSAFPTQHNKLVIFFNAGALAKSATYFIDDIRWVGATKTEAANQNSFKIWPNPTTDFLYFENFGENSGKIEMSDVFGRPQIFDFFDGKIDVGSLKPGIYFLKIGGVSKVFFKE